MRNHEGECIPEERCNEKGVNNFYHKLEISIFFFKKNHSQSARITKSSNHVDVLTHIVAIRLIRRQVAKSANQTVTASLDLNATGI